MELILELLNSWRGAGFQLLLFKTWVGMSLYISFTASTSSSIVVGTGMYWNNWIALKNPKPKMFKSWLFESWRINWILNPSWVASEINWGLFVDRSGFPLSYWMYIVFASLPKIDHFNQIAIKTFSMKHDWYSSFITKIMVFVIKVPIGWLLLLLCTCFLTINGKLPSLPSKRPSLAWLKLARATSTRNITFVMNLLFLIA